MTLSSLNIDKAYMKKPEERLLLDNDSLEIRWGFFSYFRIRPPPKNGTMLIRMALHDLWSS